MKLSHVYAVIHGHESGVLEVFTSLAEGGAAEGESVGFEICWEEAGADGGAGLEDWGIDRFGHVEWYGIWKCNCEAVDSHEYCWW